MDQFKNLLVCGCSYSSGWAFENLKNNPICWANQLAEKLHVENLNNMAKSGANNLWIFLELIGELRKQHYDLVLVQWSSIPRYHFRAGLELYTVDTMLTHRSDDINLVGHETISGKWLAETGDRLRRLHNDHWDILDLVKYVNTLIEIQQSRNAKVFFINGLAPWSDRYFDKKTIQYPNDLDLYTRNTVLESDLRDDSEILALYEMIHDHYSDYGGIQEEYWLNLYEPMKQTLIDTISAVDEHPGPLSQGFFAQRLYQKILEKTNSSVA